MVVVWIISPGVSSGGTLVRFVSSGFGCPMKLELGDSSFLPPCAILLLPSSSFLPSVARVLSCLSIVLARLMNVASLRIPFTVPRSLPR